MTTRLKINQTKGIFYIIVCIVTFLHALVANAQPTEKRVFRLQGFESSYGIRVFQVASNIKQIDMLSVMTEGGSAGLIAGSKVMRTRITTGFFYSASSVVQTVDAFELDASTILFPLKGLLKNKRTRPYVTSGLTYNKIKFAGGYLNKDGVRQNRSITTDEYIGKLHQFNLTGGLGTELSLLDKFDFLNLFIEAKINLPIQSETNTSAFLHTETTAQLVMNIGVRFGANY